MYRVNVIPTSAGCTAGRLISPYSTTLLLFLYLLLFKKQSVLTAQVTVTLITIYVLAMLIAELEALCHFLA